jgi:hypothetical protein
MVSDCATMKITLKWQNNPNNYKAFPFIQIVFFLYIVIKSTNICHYEILTIVVKLDKHNPQP